MGFEERSSATKYTPQDGDTLEKIAKRESDSGNPLTGAEIGQFNWGTGDADIIEEYLRDELGCYKRGEDKCFVISADAEAKSDLLIPKSFTKSGLAINKTHTLLVKKEKAPPNQFETCCKVEGITFEFDSSFIRPWVVGDLAKVEEEHQKHPESKIIIYGHTDKVGSEQYNKGLSERRAKSVYAFITNQPEIWEDELYQQEGWGIKCVQEILKDMGDPYDPGPVDGINGSQTKKAVREFQEDNGLTVDGIAGQNTRYSLFSSYMAGKHDIKIEDSDFMEPKTVGCGEYNPVKDTEEKHEPNRRVTFYFFNEKRLPVIPCQEGNITPCKKQISDPLLRHRDEFTCSFYDSIARFCKCENPHLPGKPKKPEEKITVTIKAKNGVSSPPTAVGIKQKVKLKAVPSKGTGTYKWSTTSKKITLENDTKQIVTVVGGKTASSAPDAEEIQLIFTPSGKDALAPVKHKMGVAAVAFSAWLDPPKHPWGHDAYEKIECRDKDRKDFDEQPGPKIDFVSIQRADAGISLFSTPEVGRVKVTISGCKPKDVYFICKNPTLCKPKSDQPDKSPFMMEIERINPMVNKSVAYIEARIGSKFGPVAATIGVVVLKLINYKVAWYRVVDPDSPKTKLNHSITGKEVQDLADYYYRQGVAKWDISGGNSETEVGYDPDKDGDLALEPGKTTEGEKKIMKKCNSKRTRAIYVKNITWYYYFAKDAKKTDTKIFIKKYGATYLNYLGLVKRLVKDNKGNSTKVKIKKINTSTGEIELDAAIGKDFKTADKAAILFPLAGLSGNPMWVEDAASSLEVCNVACHECGHELAGFDDIGEKQNLMHGTSSLGSKLRFRRLSKYYKKAEKEKQWISMKGR